MRKINFSQKNQNPISCMWYKNSKSLKNSIDNFRQIFTFSLRLLFVTKEKTFPSPSKIFHSPHFAEHPLPLNAIWKTLPVVPYEQNFVEHS